MMGPQGPLDNPYKQPEQSIQASLLAELLGGSGGAHLVLTMLRHERIGVGFVWVDHAVHNDLDGFAQDGGHAALLRRREHAERPLVLGRDLEALPAVEIVGPHVVSLTAPSQKLGSGRYFEGRREPSPGFARD